MVDIVDIVWYALQTTLANQCHIGEVIRIFRKLRAKARRCAESARSNPASQNFSVEFIHLKQSILNLEHHDGVLLNERRICS